MNSHPHSLAPHSGHTVRRHDANGAPSQIVHDMVGSSAAMRRVYELIARIAPSSSTVLIHGESGTGKELVALAIHHNSPRARGPLVALNCAALPENLLETELFGHVRGAFTGAVADKKGRFELAEGGTIFLDEIGELPLSLQAKVLRALQEREFERVGGTRSVRVNVRVIAATNSDLRAAVQKGTFRPDLYFRLNVLSVCLPPLRERREDIPVLAEYFVRKHAAHMDRMPVLSLEAQTCLQNYGWPGNVRELQNAIEHALILGSREIILPGDLPETIIEACAEPEPESHGYRSAVRHFKRQLILGAIRRSRGCLTDAARTLKVNPTYLHRLVRNLGLREAVRVPVAVLQEPPTIPPADEGRRQSAACG